MAQPGASHTNGEGQATPGSMGDDADLSECAQKVGHLSWAGTILQFSLQPPRCLLSHAPSFLHVSRQHADGTLGNICIGIHCHMIIIVARLLVDAIYLVSRLSTALVYYTNKMNYILKSNEQVID